MTLKLSTLPGQLSGSSKRAGSGEARGERCSGCFGNTPTVGVRFPAALRHPLTLTWTVLDADQSPLAEFYLSVPRELEQQ